MFPEEVGRELGFELASWEPAATGQGRTHFAQTSNGKLVVIKWSDQPVWGKHLPAAVRYTNALVERGYPTARVLAHGTVGNGYGIVQERLPGNPVNDSMTADVLDEVLDAIELQADAPDELYAGVKGYDWVPSVVFDDSAGWWQAARALGPDVEALCDRLQRWVNAVTPPEAHSDFVHIDLNFGNILALDNKLSGIIDLDHVGLGDRSVDIARLAFDIEGYRFDNGEAALQTMIPMLQDRVLSISGETGWRTAIGYHSVSWLGWSSPTGFRVPIEKAIATVNSFLE